MGERPDQAGHRAAGIRFSEQLPSGVGETLLAADHLLEHHASFAAGLQLRLPAGERLPGGIDRLRPLAMREIECLQFAFHGGHALGQRRDRAFPCGGRLHHSGELEPGRVDPRPPGVGDAVGLLDAGGGTVQFGLQLLTRLFQFVDLRCAVGHRLPGPCGMLVRTGRGLLAGGQTVDQSERFRLDAGNIGLGRRDGLDRGHLFAGSPLQVVLEPGLLGFEFTPPCAEHREGGLGGRCPRRVGGKRRPRRLKTRLQFHLYGGECRGVIGRVVGPALGRGECVAGLGKRALDAGHGRIDIGQILGGGSQSQRTKPVGHLLPAACPCGLMTHGLQPARDLAYDVGEPLAVLLAALQAAERLGPPRPEAGDAGGFLEDGPAIAARGHEQRIDAALLNDTVGLGRGARAREEFADVAEPRGFAVDEVFVLSAAVDAAGDLHLRGIEREQVVGVVEDERHFRRIERLAAARSGEDHVGHVAATQAADRLLAEHPLDGIDDVRLARSVGADDRSDARGKLEPRPVGKALEAEQFEGREPGHEDSSVGGAALAAPSPAGASSSVDAEGMSRILAEASS